MQSGGPMVEQRGRWMAAVLSCGPEALLGYRSAAAHWGLVDRAAEVIDLATQLGDERVEAAVNAADRLDLIDPESLRAEVELTPPRPGVSRLLRLVETDGIRYHRTPGQQARDLKLEQAHAAAGLTALRFPAAQVFGEPSQVLLTLKQVIARLESSQD